METKPVADSNKEVKYEITGDPSGYVSAMQQAATATTGMAAHVKAQMDLVSKTFEAVQGKLVMLAAVVAGGKFFKDAIDASNKLAGEQGALSKRLGITGDEASALNTALGDIGSDSGTYLGAFDKFAKQLSSNEAGLQAMGLQTRGANGHLRDSNTLFTEAIQKVGEYKPGLDQNTAAQKLFGEGVQDAMKLQKLNNGLLEEARQKNEALGFTLTQEGVAAGKAYKAAMNDVGDVLDAVKNQIGKALMPVFTDLSNWFAQIGPAAVTVIKGAIGGLSASFHIVTTGVTVLWETINAMVVTVAEPIRALIEGLGKALSGDFVGAKASIASIGTNIAGAWGQALNEMTTKAEKTREQIWNLFANGTPVAAPKGGTNTMYGKPGKPDASTPVKSDMPVYEEGLAKARTAAAELDAIHGMSKQNELAYWQNVLNSATLKETDRVAVTSKAEQARLQLLQQTAQQQMQLGQISNAQFQASELARVDAEQQAAQLRTSLGEQTQEQLLQQELLFETRRQAIREAAIARSMAVLDSERDLVQVAQLNAQLEQTEQQHQQRMAQIRGQMAIRSAQETSAVWQGLSQHMSNLWDNGVNAMMNGTFTWRNAQKAVGAEMVTWFAEIVKKQVFTWAFGEQGKTSATAVGTAQRTLMETWAAAKSVALWAATAVKNIMSSAWEAMAGAWKAMVGIPYVGPFLAVGAAAAAFAGVAALAGNVASASGGYDIPSMTNPITQLHAQEMVLPAHIANPLRESLADGRGLSGGAGAGGGGGDVHVTVRGAAAGDFFMLHKADLVKAIKSARRDGHF